jgi:hypothetical protein
MRKNFKKSVKSITNIIEMREMSLKKYIQKDFARLKVTFESGHFILPAAKCELQPNFLSCQLSNEPFYFVNIYFDQIKSIEFEAKIGMDYFHHKITVYAGCIN